MDLTKYQLLDPSKWDNLWRERLSISEVKKEAVKVFIVNASKDPKVPGLAQWGARVVLNLGGAVLETDNSFVDFLENTVVAKDPEQVTVVRLAETLRIKKVIHVNDLDQNLGYNQQFFRTPVSIVLTSF